MIKFENIATLENAKAWEAASEKWMFCENLLSDHGVELDITNRHRQAERIVERLENLFEGLLHGAPFQATAEKTAEHFDNQAWNYFEKFATCVENGHFDQCDKWKELQLDAKILAKFYQERAADQGRPNLFRICAN